MKRAALILTTTVFMGCGYTRITDKAEVIPACDSCGTVTTLPVDGENDTAPALTPTPEPSPSPVPTVTPSPSLVPTVTPSPSPSPVPTATPEPDVTPSPSPTPSPIEDDGSITVVMPDSTSASYQVNVYYTNMTTETIQQADFEVTYEGPVTPLSFTCWSSTAYTFSATRVSFTMHPTMPSYYRIPPGETRKVTCQVDLPWRSGGYSADEKLIKGRLLY